MWVKLSKGHGVIVSGQCSFQFKIALVLTSYFPVPSFRDLEKMLREPFQIFNPLWSKSAI
jgi:hypothetical protein